VIEPKLELDPVWKRPFELAWESLRAGSFPVGAVIVNASGEVVAEGRNRIYERAGPAGQLAGTSLAHAEINALAQLPDGRYGDYLLRTTLAPCILCTSALRMARIGEVHFAATDRVWDGMQQLHQMLSKNAARYWTVRRGTDRRDIASPRRCAPGTMASQSTASLHPRAGDS